MRQTLRAKVLTRNFIDKVPVNFYYFYYSLKNSDYESALHYLGLLDDIRERILYKIPEEEYERFLEVAATRVINKYDLIQLLAAVVKGLVSKEILLEQIKKAGYNSFRDFILDCEFIYSLFTSKGVRLFNAELRDMACELGEMFADEANYLVAYNDIDTQHVYMTSLYFLYRELEGDEVNDFREQFLNRIEELPLNFAHLKKLVKHLFQ